MPANTTRNPIQAPGYSLHREGVSAVDVLANVTKEQGINMQSNGFAHVQVLPSGGANPTVQVYWWSEGAGAFIQEHTPISKAGVGINTPFEFSVEARGRIMYVAVTTLAGGSVNVAVAGFNTERV